jgi:predicted O-methyltransferase YrrM
VAQRRGRVHHDGRGAPVALATPPLVERALALAAELGFAKSCSAEAGRLLHLLATQRGRERVGEVGTGAGVGTAWLASALAPGASLWTAEADAALARAAGGLFADDSDVHVLAGPWRELLPAQAPFDLLFYDGGRKQVPEEEGEAVVELLAPGGTVVLDDFRERRPHDPVKAFWLGHPRLAGAELGLSDHESAIVCVRVL